MTLKTQGEHGLLESGVGGLYTVRSDRDGQCYVLRARGIFRKQGRIPLVGDRVLFSPGRGEEHGWLDDILPRKNEIKRPHVANLDQLLIAIAPEPLPDLLLVDRLLVWARQAQVHTVLVLNKIDLDEEQMQACALQYAGAELDGMFMVSAQNQTGLEALKGQLSGKISCFAGQSAVGKSSLINVMYGLALPTGEMSRRTVRGRHTTRHVQLLHREDATLLDTPGFSLLELWPQLAPEELAQYYPEYGRYAGQCRFTPCLHDHEPDCAVQRAVLSDELSKERYDRYRVLLAQVRENWRGRYD